MTDPTPTPPSPLDALIRECAEKICTAFESAIGLGSDPQGIANAITLLAPLRERMEALEAERIELCHRLQVGGEDDCDFLRALRAQLEVAATVAPAAVSYLLFMYDQQQQRLEALEEYHDAHVALKKFYIKSGIRPHGEEAKFGAEMRDHNDRLDQAQQRLAALEGREGREGR